MFKGTVSVIFKICKDGNVNLVNNVDFTVTFLGLKMFNDEETYVFSCSRHFCRGNIIKNI